MKRNVLLLIISQPGGVVLTVLIRVDGNIDNHGSLRELVMINVTQAQHLTRDPSIVRVDRGPGETDRDQAGAEHQRMLGSHYGHVIAKVVVNVVARVPLGALPYL